MAAHHRRAHCPGDCQFGEGDLSPAKVICHPANGRERPQASFINMAASEISSSKPPFDSSLPTGHLANDRINMPDRIDASAAAQIIKPRFTIDDGIIRLVDHQTGTLDWVKSLPTATVMASSS